MLINAATNRYNNDLMVKAQLIRQEEELQAAENLIKGKSSKVKQLKAA